MTILEKIIFNKRKEIAGRKVAFPIETLENTASFGMKTVSFKDSIINNEGFGIIAEFKRKSPSKGDINASACPVSTCRGYLDAGASALSVITDARFFGGSDNDLVEVSGKNFRPVLRKEFIIDEYQVIESKSLGADALLLIAEVLTTSELRGLFDTARSLGMEVLFEVHEESSINKLPAEAEIIGVNSRNLNSFAVSTDHALDMIRHIPPGVVKVAESGIDSPETYHLLRSSGFNGFLIGELFMREADPSIACRQFISDINIHYK